MENRKFEAGDIVKHFKRETLSEERLTEDPNAYLYEIIGTARHNIKHIIKHLFIFIPFLFVTFPTITSTAQQLCIREYCPAAETPRGFVVNL